MYLMPSATLISSFVTLSSGTSTRKPDVGFGGGRNEDGDNLLPGLLLHLGALLAREKADGIHSFTRKFHQDDGLE